MRLASRRQQAKKFGGGVEREEQIARPGCPHLLAFRVAAALQRVTPDTPARLAGHPFAMMSGLLITVQGSS